MFYTDDPIRDYDRYEAEQEAKLKRLPKCSQCHNPIDADFYYEVDCYLFCEDCLNDVYRHPIEMYLDM